LERIKQKRLEEIRRQIMLRQLREKQETVKKAQEKNEKISNRELLDKHFGDRAWEVYNAATAQYPQIMPQIEQILVEGIKTGKISNIIDGAALMGFFRTIGLPVRLETKIRISEKGELKSLEEKMKEDLT